jgi:septum site-determining protein MinC
MRDNLQLANRQASFQLKGSLLSFTVLQLIENNLSTFATQLATLVKQTPNFFRHAPMIIDLEKLIDRHDIIDFDWIKAELTKYKMIPVGIRNGTPQHEEAAMAAGLGILAASKNESQKSSSAMADAALQSHIGKVQSQPVRSGQQIYSPHGDLIVITSVSAGAELIAHGHIHVYGPLRGRALAGVNGDTHARIFCQKLEAELISIAGFYKLRDDIKLPKDADNGVQIYLENEQLHIAAL